MKLHTVVRDGLFAELIISDIVFINISIKRDKIELKILWYYLVLIEYILIIS